MSTQAAGEARPSKYDRLIAAARNNTSWNTEAEKQSVLSMLRQARVKYAKMAE